MKNCNCNKKLEPVVPCSNPCDRRDHVIKLFVDECSGRPVDPVTVATAVFTEDCKSVEEMLDILIADKDNLQLQLDNLTNDTTNIDNHQSLLYRLRLLEITIQNLSTLLSLLGNYASLFADIANLKAYDTANTTDVTNLKSKVATLENQLTTVPDYSQILTSIQTILSSNNDLFEDLLDKLNNGNLEGYYNKDQIDYKIQIVNTSITNLTERLEEIELSYLKGFVDDSDIFVEDHEILPSAHGILRIDPLAKSGSNSNLSDYSFILKGDVNGDGKVDVLDVNALINIISRFKTRGDYPGEADIAGTVTSNNEIIGDGKIDVSDVNEVINIILKLRPLKYVIKNVKTFKESDVSKNLMYFNTRTNKLCYLVTTGNSVTGLKDIEYGADTQIVDVSKIRGYFYRDTNNNRVFLGILDYINSDEGNLPNDSLIIDGYEQNDGEVEINGVTVDLDFPIKRKVSGVWTKVGKISIDPITGEFVAENVSESLDGGELNLG